jgi:hypothetical protein
MADNHTHAGSYLDRTIGRTVVSDNDFAGYAIALEHLLEFFDADADCAFFVEARQHYRYKRPGCSAIAILFDGGNRIE